jgi:hypothetical protein
MLNPKPPLKAKKRSIRSGIGLRPMRGQVARDLFFVSHEEVDIKELLFLTKQKRLIPPPCTIR